MNNPETLILEGKQLAEEILLKLQKEIASSEGRKPCLAPVLVGNDSSSEIYIKRKINACKQIGMDTSPYYLPASISEADLLHKIDKLNADPHVDGILVQSPLPKHINYYTISSRINPQKDVDGFHPLNVGKLSLGDTSGFAPCTPLGIINILKYWNISPQSKHVVILGRSSIVGKPIALLLLQNCPMGNATITVLHSKSKNINEICKMADIIIVAIGKPNFLQEHMVKQGAVVVDVGINRVDDATQKKGYKIVGDVDFEKVQHKCSAITPVPGGVGPLTIAMLLSNTVKSWQRSC